MAVCLLSDLPANRELIGNSSAASSTGQRASQAPGAAAARQLAAASRQWVRHGLEPGVQRFLDAAAQAVPTHGFCSSTTTPARPGSAIGVPAYPPGEWVQAGMR